MRPLWGLPSSSNHDQDEALKAAIGDTKAEANRPHTKTVDEYLAILKRIMAPTDLIALAERVSQQFRGDASDEVERLTKEVERLKDVESDFESFREHHRATEESESAARQENDRLQIRVDELEQDQLNAWLREEF